ncbi:hypothetical protein RE2895_14320 [Rhodococcus erythropolis]|nr:hypothetical protein RE2895_14320 [Rhodococcus erythropolis]GCB55054.1 hypothetical protein rerp_14620 [Rhodococcus erythropolis]
MRLTTESALAVGALRPRKPAAMATAIVNRTVNRRAFIISPWRKPDSVFVPTNSGTMRRRVTNVRITVR